MSRALLVNGVRVIDHRLRPRRGEPRQPAPHLDRPMVTEEEKRRAKEAAAYKRRQARWLLRYAITSGKMQRGDCEVGVGCSGVIDGHHDDYDKPYQVRWFCRLHHAAFHPRTANGESHR